MLLPVQTLLLLHPSLFLHLGSIEVSLLVCGLSLLEVGTIFGEFILKFVECLFRTDEYGMAPLSL